MNKDLSEHTAVFGLDQFAIGMKDRMHVLDRDMLSTYDQDEDVAKILNIKIEEVIIVFQEASHGNWYASGVRL